MDYTNIREMIEYPKSGILSKEIIKTEKFDATLFIMAKGANLSEHTSTREGIVHVLEGKGMFILKGKEINMTPSVFIHMENNTVHALRADENMAFVLTLFN